MKLVRLYGVGGGGANNVIEYMKTSAANATVKLAPALFDTSDSNWRSAEGLIEERWVVEGAQNKGSGKVRAENGEVIIQDVKPFLLAHEPGDLNIVICTSAGGTGSVAGPEIAAELRARGEAVVLIVIEDRSDVKAVTNCIKTINSLYNVVESLDTDLVVSYHVNAGSLREVNESVANTIETLSLLFDGTNEGLDTNDLRNWLMPSKVSELEPRLYSLFITLSKESFEKVQDPVTVASLYNNMEVSQLSGYVEYSTFGYKDLSDYGTSEIHFGVGTAQLDTKLTELQDYCNKMEEQAEARKARERKRDTRLKVKTSGGRAGNTEF